MPWKECHVMDERLRFVARLLEGEQMAPQSGVWPGRNLAAHNTVIPAYLAMSSLTPAESKIGVGVQDGTPRSAADRA